jgi:hypothetical protein
MTLAGRVHGKTIELDEAVAVPLEGKRVRVVLEVIEGDEQLSAAARASAWREWLERGPQGPIDDDAEPEFP